MSIPPETVSPPPGLTGTGAADGGALKRIATSRLTLAGAGVLAVAAVTAGGFVLYDQVIADHSETVAAAAGALEEARGFTVRVERTFSRAHAEEVAEGNRAPAEQVVEDSRVEEEYLYSAEAQTFLVRGEVMGPGTTAVANHGGDLYVYASRDEAPGLWDDSPQRLEPDDVSAFDIGEEGTHALLRHSPAPLEPGPGVDTGSVAATLVTAPLRAMAEAGGVRELRGQDRVYTGSTVLGLLHEGEFVEEAADGRVGLDGEGTPVWAEYTTERWEVRVDFEEVNAETPVEDPQVWAAENVEFGWTVVHAPICGTVAAPSWGMDDGAGRLWDVQASGWDMDCDYTMDVAETLADLGAHRDRYVALYGARGISSGIWQIDDRMACGGFHTTEPSASYYGPCQESTVLAAGDALDVHNPAEVDFGPVTLIDFHEHS